jgi:hypothetical protein
LDLADKYDLNYQVLNSEDRYGRVKEAAWWTDQLLQEKADKIYYDRRGL